MTLAKSWFDQELGLFLFRILTENGISGFHLLQMLSEKRAAPGLKEGGTGGAKGTVKSGPETQSTNENEQMNTEGN